MTDPREKGMTKKKGLSNIEAWDREFIDALASYKTKRRTPCIRLCDCRFNKCPAAKRGRKSKSVIEWQGFEHARKLLRIVNKGRKT